MKRSHTQDNPAEGDGSKVAKMSTKKLMNDPERIVDEALEGLVATTPGLTAVENHRVVVRSDLESVKGKVAVICGGGSGHEPAFAGYVGKGCLSAAIAGSVFASPPPTSIMAAILKVAEHKPSGILVVVYNYTGDRVNFGLAVERARAVTDVRCEMFVNADDTALTTADRTAGRRGLSGGKLILKIAGAMAEAGKNLDDILNTLGTKIMPNMGTIGLSMSPCIVPGRSSASFTLAPDEMELGLGVHGEAGVKRIKLATARDTVKTMLTHMTNPNSSTHLTLKNGDYVAVMLNNLGAISAIEMGVLTNEVVKQLQENHNVSVRRLYCGHFFTSLEMAGFSITVLRMASTEIATYLDAETTVGGWSGQAYPRKIEGPRPKLSDPILKIKHDELRGPEANKFAKEALLKAVTFACEAVISCEDQLNLMDSGSGDSDCGSTLKRGAEQVLNEVRSHPEIANRPANLFHKISEIAEKDMGGSSGGMYSLLFGAASAYVGNVDVFTSEVIGKAFEAGLAAMMKYGRGQVGDRTMIDSLSPAINAFLTSVPSSEHLKALEAATCAAEQGAKATLTMKASAGRASYVPSSELKHPDPGAHAIGIIMRAVFEGVKIKANEMGMH